MDTRKVLFALLLAAPALALAVGPPPAPRAESLIGQLGSDDFAIRQEAARQLARLGDPALPALRRALKSPDLEVRRRADEIIREISRRVEPRVIARHVEEIHRDGLSSFVRRMVTEEGFATENRWGAIAQLARLAARRAVVAGKVEKLDTPNLNVHRMGIFRGTVPSDTILAEGRVLIEEKGGMVGTQDCLVLSSGLLSRVTSIYKSILVVDGDLDCTSIERSIVVCRGDIDATGIDNSLVLCTGVVSATSIDDSVVEAGNGFADRSSAYRCAFFGKAPKRLAQGTRVLNVPRTPLQLFPFTPAAKP